MNVYDFEKAIVYPIGSMYARYGNIYHPYTPVMLAYIPAPWILWVWQCYPSRPGRNTRTPRRREKLRRDAGELEYAFLFEPAKAKRCRCQVSADVMVDINGEVPKNG